METKLANPAPLGLMGFGMTTILLNLHNAGFILVSDMIIAMGVFYGGIAQVIAGIMEFKKGNTFGMTAFISYGFFWLTLIAIFIFPDVAASKGVRADSNSVGWYLFLWGVFTFFMWMATFGKSWVLQFVFLSLWILFFLLATHNWTGFTWVGRIAGWEGILCGISAVYLAMAEVLEESRGKKILPF